MTVPAVAPPNASARPPLLSIERLFVNYGGIQALQDVTLDVNEGEVVTLIGANGAGKSTTLRAISRLLTPRAGRILYGSSVSTCAPTSSPDIK